MKQKTDVTKPSSEKVIKDIRRITRKQYGAEEKIRIVLDGLRGEESIAALCRCPSASFLRQRILCRYAAGSCVRTKPALAVSSLRV
jgi:transposase-like protein